MLEAFLTQLSVELPHIRTVALQSDNAGCYQVKELLLLIAILNTSNQIRIVRFIHTETQDGKGLIDAHFAKGTAHLTKFMKTSQQNRIRTNHNSKRSCCSRYSEFICSADQRKASEIEGSSWQGSKRSKRILCTLQRYVLYGV